MLQYSMEDTFIYIWYITLVLFVIDLVLLILGWAKKRLTALEGILIMLTVGLLPIGIAYFASTTARSWAGMGRGILGYVYSSFVLAICAVFILIYLLIKRK